MTRVRVSRTGEIVNIEVWGDDFDNSYLLKEYNLLEYVNQAPVEHCYVDFLDGSGVRSRHINIKEAEPRKMSRAEECKRRAGEVRKQKKEEEIRMNDTMVDSKIEEAVRQGEGRIRVIGGLSANKQKELKDEGFALQHSESSIFIRWGN